MVQKLKKLPSAAKIDAPVAPKRRGRPRAYQPDIALGKVLICSGGRICGDLTRRSQRRHRHEPAELYGAFATNASSTSKSYQRYRDDARAAMIDIFRNEAPLRERLARIYTIALDIYLSGESGPRGCFT